MKKEKMKKKEKICLGRKIEDGLLLVVFAKIHGQNVKALIESGAIRCFVTPTCMRLCVD